MNKNLTLTILSGLLLGIPFCIPQLFFLIFFAWIPLLAVEESCNRHHNPYLLFNYAFVSFSIWNTMAYWWVAKAQLVGVILIILLNSLVLALVFWSISKARKTIQRPVLLPFLIIWLGFEYFHTQWDLAWPWLNLGNTFSSVPQLIQWYEFTGTRGGSLWIILINISLYAVIKSYKQITRTQLAIPIVLFLAPVLFSLQLYQQNENKTGSKTFALIQPNLDPYSEKFIPENEKKHFEEFIHKADSLCRQFAPDLLLGPETMILTPINEDNPSESYYYKALQQLKEKYPATEILLGAHTKKAIKKRNESYNSAIFINSTNTSFYHKTKLVPLFERIPFDRYLSFLNDYSLEIGGYHGTYSSRNSTAYFLSADSTVIVPIVCFESIFGDYCARRTPQKAGFLCMITNDGWWKNTPGYQHHFNFSLLRAIENRRQLIRVGNNGISALIDSKGTIIDKSKWWHKTTLTGRVAVIKCRTFYSVHGDFIGRICLFFALLLLVFATIKTHTQKPLGKKQRN